MSSLDTTKRAPGTPRARTRTPQGGKRPASVGKTGGKRRREECGGSILADSAGSKLRIEGDTATRTNGTAHAVCFTELPAGQPAYVECEVRGIESRMSTMAVGFTTALPTHPNLLDCAKDLSQALLIGYDLPRVVQDGKETRLRGVTWRPLKDLKVGDVIGCLFHAQTLVVTVNGEEKVNMPVSWPHTPTHGVFDVHGHVSCLRVLSGRGGGRALALLPPPTPPTPPTPRSPSPAADEVATWASVHGWRLQIDGSVASRRSGVCNAVGFAELPRPFFEVEILRLEKGTRTFALGFCAELPEAKSIRLLDAASDLPKAVLVGYDLPKLVVDGKATRIRGCEWRPLKDLQVGDCVGVLYKDCQVVVFHNGKEVIRCDVPAQPKKLFGVVDVHGTVAQVRLRESFIPTRAELKTPGASPGRALKLPGARPYVRLLHKASVGDAEQRVCPAVVEVGAESFAIGRDGSKVDCVVDSLSKPNFISRVHCRVSRDQGKVFVEDCGGVNGTFVNHVRIAGKVQLAGGDLIVLGGGGQYPAGTRKVQSESDFQFTVSMQ